MQGSDMPITQTTYEEDDILDSCQDSSFKEFYDLFRKDYEDKEGNILSQSQYDLEEDQKSVSETKHMDVVFEMGKEELESGKKERFFDVERENKELKKILRNMEMKLSVAQRDICNKDFLTRDLLRKLEEVDENSRSLMGNVDESDRMDSDVVELKDMKILENKELFQLNEELNDRLQCKNEMIYELKKYY